MLVLFGMVGRHWDTSQGQYQLGHSYHYVVHQVVAPFDSASDHSDAFLLVFGTALVGPGRRTSFAKQGV